jgi:hypothetical protein
MTTSEEFVAQLERTNAEAIERMHPDEAPSGSADLLALLRIAMKNELEAFELASHWIPTTPELDVKLGLARQVGDEAKHYGLIAGRYRELGGDLESFNPLEGGFSRLFHYLTGLSTSVERLAAGQFTREAIARTRNDMFIEFLRYSGDSATAALYEGIIQPDESYHQELGKSMLLKYAVTSEAQTAARQACQRTLEIAGSLRAGAIQKTGVHQIPGC